MTMVVKWFGKDVAKNFLTMATFCDGGASEISATVEFVKLIGSIAFTQSSCNGQD